VGQHHRRDLGQGKVSSPSARATTPGRPVSTTWPKRFASIHRFDGVNASLGGARSARPGYLDPNLRISGEVVVPLTVTR